MEIILNVYIIACTTLVWVGLSYVSIRYTYRVFPTLTYMPIEATIINLNTFEVAKITSEFDDSKIDKRLRITYRFLVGNQSYKGNFEAGGYQFAESDTKKKHPLYLGKLAEGDALTVYYNENNPSESHPYRTEFYVSLVYIVLSQSMLLLTIKLIGDL